MGDQEILEITLAFWSLMPGQIGGIWNSKYKAVNMFKLLFT